ncbi:MAG: Gfo/Idh/MocA family protein [Planctomycetota bacterium]
MAKETKKTSRREFMIQGSQAAAGLVAAGSLAPIAAGGVPRVAPFAGAGVQGANERINLAVIGIRSRGMQLARGFAGLPNVRIKTLVDIDENLFPSRVKELEEKQGFAPGTRHDLRQAFEDKEIDAVAIANTNHWHALSTIWACQAGKHVYVEKPSSHNIFEGRKMVEAARRYEVLVSVGYQNRSSKNVRKAMKFLHEGGIGEVYLARGLCFKPRESLGRCPDGYGAGDYDYYVHGRKGPPYDHDYMKGVHYDLWLGPAPERPFNHNRFHYNWHWFWDYGCGDIGNQGPHQFDIARWGLGETGHPETVHSDGGYFAFDSAQETPNTQSATFKYADGKVLQFEVRGLYTNAEGAYCTRSEDGVYDVAHSGVRIGNLFFGSKGWMYLNGTTWKTYFGRKNEPGPSNDTMEESADPMNFAGAGGGNHFENFILALRSGKRENLTSEIGEGHISTALPHLANISYRTGRKLVFDGAKERFVDDEEADRMLTRPYRRPFIVPEEV